MSDRDDGSREENHVDARLARHGGLTFVEIPARDLSQSAAFYEQVVGWKVEWRARDDARFADPAGYLIGRWVIDRPAAREPGLVPYVYVDGVEEAVARAVALGGEVIRAIYPEGNLLVATVRDPAGNLIGLWQEGRQG